MNIAGADTEGQVIVLAEGSATEAAVIRTTAPGTPFLTMLKPLWSIVDQPDFTITTDYILEPGAPALKMVTTASLTPEFSEATALEGSTEGLELLQYAMVSGLSFGDFFLQGGSVDVFAPGGGFDEDRLVADAVNDGKNTFNSPFQFPSSRAWARACPTRSWPTPATCTCRSSPPRRPPRSAPVSRAT